MSGPLAGLRGIVLTQAWAGSYCTNLLGYLGADIIQVEVTKRLDSWRGAYNGTMPAALAAVPTAAHPWNCNPLYNSVNLNKRCITLDLQAPEGVAVYRRLLPFADFVAENFSPRVLGNLGLSYAEICRSRPDIILCSLSAYGHDGPWANTPGIGGTIEPASGMSALVGYEGGPPMNSGQMYPDAVAGLNAATAILAAVHYRNRTGKGQYIDLSMQEANLSFVGEAALEYQVTGVQPPRMGNRHHTFAPHGIYPCAGDDQWVALACETEQQWRKFCVLLNEDWITDPRFVTAADRKANEDELDALIATETRRIKREILVIMFEGVGVVVAPVLDGREVAADAAPRARGMVADVMHREAGAWPQAVSPFHFSRTTPHPVRPAPLLGEHTLEVMKELLGSTPDEYEALVAAGVSGTEQPK